jgi:RNA polymerase sigma-70 factor, ECF subfamily
MRQALSVVSDRTYAALVQPAAEPVDDSELTRRIIGAASTRDAEAEALLCRRFAPRIRLFGLKRLRSDAAAADLVQDVLMMVLQKLRAGAVREPERIASFMLGTARQLVIDTRRNSGRRERLLDTFALDLEPDDAPAADSPDTDRLQHCLQALPERERSVVVMTFYDECPAEMLGAQLGLNAGNVRVIRHRGLKHLRDCLQSRETS